MVLHVTVLCWYRLLRHFTQETCAHESFIRFVLFHSLMPQDCMTALYSIGIRNFYMFFFIVISPLLRVEIRSVGCGRRVANCLWGGTDKAVCTRWNKEVARPCQRALPLPSSVYVEAVNQIFLLCAIFPHLLFHCLPCFTHHWFLSIFLCVPIRDWELSWVSSVVYFAESLFV